ncbi:mucin-15 [Syngnathoides biaculeatus]|uniref:mucin-15 n=1 Tax=Syngnathoides biaculeatus TaxID=300417 RepID=UPI002ADE6588|nr:mucin-15 [Syngnathoides biaculeatus]XP_061670010.1 mucin-15 [Syngnathoides biaculeatus]XP_061670011.1 mucin-15 [Syngnathoides biaculeatus]XP_061670013.1 mucin-15 [Syngnathoides biaculeatus]
MEWHFIFVMHLLLFVHTFYSVSAQKTTNSPKHTFDESWLRQQNFVSEEEGENGQEGEMIGMETSNNFTTLVHQEDNNLDNQEVQMENITSDPLDVAITTEPLASPNHTTEKSQLSDETTNITNPESKQSNITKNEEEFNNSTMPPALPDADLFDQNVTISPDFSNHNAVDNTTTLAPESRDSDENTTLTATTTTTTNSTTTTNTTISNSMDEIESTNSTESNNATAITTAAPEMNQTSATSLSSTVLSSEASSVATVAPTTPEGNLTDKQVSSGSSSDRGLSSETSSNKRNEAWGAVLATAVVVSVVGLVAYIILKRKHLKGFSHRKLVEEFPSDPVLRLDNSEPLDLNFGRSAYYNPGLRGDEIQLENIPGRQTK